jgi:hypothetical protein
MRPAPEILLENHTTDFYTTQVVQAPDWWVVCYQGRPCQLKQISRHIDRTKYIRNGSPHAATTRNLAHKLNVMFDTEDFVALKVM